MIRINENIFNINSYESLQRKLINDVLIEVFSDRKKAKELKKKIEPIIKRKVYLSEFIEEIIKYDASKNNYANKYCIAAYIKTAFFYNKRKSSSNNLESRKEFLGQLYTTAIDPENQELQNFIPSYQELSNLSGIETRISNEEKFLGYLKDKIFKEYLEFDATCKLIFDYSKFISPIRSAIIREMNIEVCPYCNENLIHKVNSNERALADIDHFFMQTKFPLFSLTFSNFIPSCSLCNRTLKGQSAVEILNPRYEGFEHSAIFELESPILDEKLEDVKIKLSLKIPSNSKKYQLIKESINLFALEDRYNHNDMKKTLLKLNRDSKSLSKGMLESYIYILDEDADTKNITFEKIYKHIFGFDVDTNDFINIKYGKLTADIFNKYNFQR